MITLDGSVGEGGGQILRTALALSLVTGQPFRIERIRARREKPGLMRQHLAAVNAAAEVGQAAIQGAALTSQTLDFKPSRVTPGHYRFAVGTAGSTTLVLQTVLPALMLAEAPSELILEGGTHNPMAPPFDFLARAFLPLLARMGPQVTAVLERPGFFPAGGGLIRIEINPAPLAPLELPERGTLITRRARASVAHLPLSIAERELKVVREQLGWAEQNLSAETITNSAGPGNVLTIEVESEYVTEVFTGFGQRGVPAETVARRCADEAREYLAASAPVGPHLADQLLLPLALAGSGRFRTMAPSEHTTTNAEIIQKFLDVKLTMKKLGRDDWEIGAG